MCRIGSTFWSVRVSSCHTARVRGTNHLDPAISVLVSCDSVNIKRGRGACSQILIRSGTWFGLCPGGCGMQPQFSILRLSQILKMTSRADGWARRGCGRDRDSGVRDNLQSHLRCSAQSHGYSANHSRPQLSHRSHERTTFRVDHGK